MKIKLLIIGLVALLLSCQNENLDNREDWIKEIDKTIIDYGKTAKIESTKTLMENGHETIFNFYEKDFKGLQVIKGYYNVENSFVDATIEIYLQNGEIVLEKMSGLFPLLYKGQKKETDPCCELFNRLIYYKNNLEGKAYTKHLKILHSQYKEEYLNDLEMLQFVEEKEGLNIANEYISIKNYIEKLKK